MPLTNSEMVANRYLRWHRARSLYRRIVSHLDAGGEIIMATYTRAWHIKPKHREMFRETKTGVLMQRGKSWDRVDGCGFRFSRLPS